MTKLKVFWLAILAVMVFALAGCSGGSNHHDQPIPPPGVKGNVIIQDQRSTLARNGAVYSVSNNLVQALYFGELEIVAYNYRPGQSVQSHFIEGGFINPDWSYWVILQSGTDAGRNNVLKRYNSLDINAINNQNTVQTISQDFIDNVGAFNVDIFEVNVAQTGVIYDYTYYGPSLSENQFGKYPELATLPTHPAMVNYPGGLIDSGTVSILFVRSDWFQKPIVVTKQAGIYQPIAGGTLTDEQKRILTNFKNGGTDRRIYNTFIIVPFDGPIPVHFSGQGTSQTNDVNVTVSLNLTDLLDATTNLETTPYTVVYRGDSNYIPFGLSISIKRL